MRDCLLSPANKLQGSLENFFLVICSSVYDQSGSIVFKVLLFGLVKDGSRQTLQEILSDKEKKYEVGDVFEYIIDVAHGTKLFNQDMLFWFYIYNVAQNPCRLSFPGHISGDSLP